MPSLRTRMRRRVDLIDPSGEASAANGTCLVHLVRELNGLDPFRRFASALREHPAGIDHELILLMKGFASRAQAAPYLREVEDLAPRALFFPDRGFDLGVYFAAAEALRADRYCFVNSNCRPLSDGWLAKLSAALDRRSVGQVGATGSWASQHSWLMYSMGFPSAYRGLLPPPPVARELLTGLELERDEIERRSVGDRVRVRLKTLLRLPEELLAFEAFPAHHLRPNAFMIKHEVLSELELFVVRSKLDTVALENSRHSITNQLLGMGLSSLVVDCSGYVYEPDAWARSCTFWQGEQEGLLVADNQTLNYTNSNFTRRQLLATLAWGSHADTHLMQDPPVNER